MGAIVGKKAEAASVINAKSFESVRDPRKSSMKIAREHTQRSGVNAVGRPHSLAVM